MMETFTSLSGGGKVDPRVVLVQAAMVAATRSSFRSGCSTWLHELVDACGGNSRLLGERRLLAGKALDALYAFAMARMEAELHSAPAFSISFDLWTSRGRTKSLCAISYHFLDSDLNQRELVLDAAPFSRQTHNAQNIALMVARRVDSHCLESQLLYSVPTASTGNVVNASHELLQKHDALVRENARLALTEDEEELPLLFYDDDVVEEVEEDLDELSIGCIAHRLHLAVSDLLREDEALRDFVKRVQRVVVGTRRSTERQAALRIIQEVMKPEERPFSLSMSVSTRWNSLLAMVERFAHLWSFLCILFVRGDFKRDPSQIRPEKEPVVVLPLQDETDLMADGISRVLGPLRKVSRFVQGSKYPTAAHVPYLLHEQQVDLGVIAEDEDSSQEAVRFALCLQASIKNRFASHLSPDSPFVVAALLHPSCVQFVYNSQGEGDPEQGTLGRVFELLKIVRFDEQKSAAAAASAGRGFGGAPPAVPIPSSLSDGVHDPLGQQVSLMGELKNFIMKLWSHRRAVRAGHPAGFSAAVADQSPREVKGELRGSSSPSMTTVLKIVFSSSASSATPERVFSCAGLLDNALRSNLGEEKLEKLVVLGF